MWDEASGYYYDASSGFYYDGNSGFFSFHLIYLEIIDVTDYVAQVVVRQVMNYYG